MKSYTNSNNLLEREIKVSPLGAQTYSKSYRYYCSGSSPSYIEYGKGCRLFDVDGNEFIDFVCSLGPITVGFAEEAIDDAAIKQLKRGSSFSLQAPVEVELAEKIVEIVPCAEMVRFVKNGGDATTAAIRLSRAYTDREMVLKCGYHGMHDWSIGATANNRGVPEAVQELTKNFEYNDIEDLKNKLEVFKGKVAAVILEPIQGNGPAKNYLQKVVDLAHQHGAVVIFDEVVSGFRYSLGGASEYYNVVPDLAAFGKGMGNGYAISAVAGKKEILKLIEEGVFISTTFGGDAVAMAAALETIRILEKPGFYDHIWNLGSKIKEGLLALIEKYSLAEVVSVSGLAPHCGVMFEGVGNLSYLDINSIYSHTMIENGIITVGINNINMHHSIDEIEAYLVSVEKAFIEIQKAIKNDHLPTELKGNEINPVFKRNIK